MGGLGVPDFRKYYVAVHLAQLFQLHGRKYKPDWVSLEAQACSPLAMDVLLWTPYIQQSCAVSNALAFYSLVGCKLQEMAPMLYTHTHTQVAPLFGNPLFSLSI